MHATQLATAVPAASPCLVPVHAIKPGQPFVRLDSPSEVLVRLSYAGAPADDSTYTWSVVLNVNHDSEGYVPGQLLKLRSTALVRPVHEARPAVYALEH